jgi:asparagine synthase (glutamine-hydrolysing)
MCGIAGIRLIDDQINPRVLDEMCDLLHHRGPDDRGTFVEKGIGLSMRRLSIIDLSTGKQPIFNEDRSMCIVFNGEIYNFMELRSELEKRGHKFSTNSDTEVILHLYEDNGENCVQYLRGMFAFAIWDKNRERLFIARDRFGIKPLYFFWNNKVFLFASEIKSILAFPTFKRELDLEAVQQYFTFLYVPRERTLFKGISKLLPGCYLTLEKNNLNFARYYKIPQPRDQRHTMPSEAEIVDSILDVMSNTVEKHLISDVPLGAFLSGGIDSSLVVALMSKLIDQPVNTFSIGYDGEGASFDEREYALKVAKLYRTNHREVIITADKARECLPSILGELDEPIGDSSIIPNYLISEFTAKYVKVALSGLGGDELCGGYERYLGSMLAERHRRVLNLLPSSLKSAINKHLPDSATGSHFPERLKRFINYASLPMKERYYHFIAKFNTRECEGLFNRDFFQADFYSGSKVFDGYWDETNEIDGLRKFLKIDLGMYLVDDLLALSDRTSMIHSLEMRVPFIDHHLVEFFWSLPDHLKIKGLSKKYILKKTAERLLPRDIIYRKKKGFSVPLTVWFRNELKPFIVDVFSSENVKALGYFDYNYVQQILSEHISAQRNHDEKIFALLSFAVWYWKKFIP